MVFAERRDHMTHRQYIEAVLLSFIELHTKLGCAIYRSMFSYMFSHVKVHIELCWAILRLLSYILSCVEVLQ